MSNEITSEQMLRYALEQLIDMTETPPDRNCSCHISAPCSDCIDYSGLRDALAYGRSALKISAEREQLPAEYKMFDSILNPKIAASGEQSPVMVTDGWQLGDVDEGEDMWTAGINVLVPPFESSDGVHESAIECHARTKEAAELLRAKVMLAVAPLLQSAAVDHARVPGGWKLVPISADHEMLLAGVRVWDSSDADAEQLACCNATWHAMLAASPTPGES